mgnify:CR=1 FL=1
MEENEKKEEMSEEITDEMRQALILKLADPYKYDEKEITELDMNGLVDLTAGDLCSIDREMLKMGYSGMRMDTTRQYALFVGARVNKKPNNFCDRMSARDSIRLRDMVATFFYARA